MSSDLVTIYVQPTKPLVYAADDAYKTLTDTPLTIAAPGVLANDKAYLPPVIVSPNGGTQPTGDPNTPPSIPLSAKVVADATHGKVGLNLDGSFTYTPEPKFAGVDTFKYQAFVATGSNPGQNTAADPTRPADVATVTILVKAPEPTTTIVANNDYFVVAENNKLAIDKPGVLANDYIKGIVPVPAGGVISPIATGLK